MDYVKIAVLKNLNVPYVVPFQIHLLLKNIERKYIIYEFLNFKHKITKYKDHKDYMDFKHYKVYVQGDYKDYRISKITKKYL